MRTSTAYFAGVGTVVAAVVAGLGGGLLISNIVSPHSPKTEMSKLEQRMSSKPIPVVNAPSEPVSYLAATQPAASGPITVATPAEKQQSSETVSAAPTRTQPAEAPAPQPAAPVTQAATSEQSQGFGNQGSGNQGSGNQNDGRCFCQSARRRCDARRRCETRGETR